jgi:hypothetical protein
MFMRVRVFVLALCFSFMARPTRAQTWMVEGWGGYQFFGGVDATAGRLTVRDSPNAGGAISFGLDQGTRIQVFYLVQPTELRLRPWSTRTRENLFNINLHYVMGGVQHELDIGRRIIPYSGVMGGLVVMSPVTERYAAETRLAFGLQGGLRIPFNENLSLKTQAMLLFPVQWTGGNLFCGPGGCSVGVSSGTTIIQLALNAGLCITF